jgi:hypothetical protein
MMRRRNPWGPRPLSEYPSVRFAVRAWALYQCISAVVIGGLILYFGASALTQAVIDPPPPQKPKLLILRENWKAAKINPEDGPQTYWYKLTPPPKGWAYTDDYRTQVELPDGLKKPPLGYTYTAKDFRLVRISGSVLTGNGRRPAPIAPGDDAEL